MKEFDSWNILKKGLDALVNTNAIFHESEIWWCSVGLNIGDEEDGKNEKYERPVLILKKFSRNLFIGIPLSTKVKEGKYYVNFTTDCFEYSILISQTKIMSSKRLIRKINKLSRGRFSIVKQSYKDLLNL
jgi:mRNA interferase MazF